MAKAGRIVKGKALKEFNKPKQEIPCCTNQKFSLTLKKQAAIAVASSIGEQR